jgi:HAE1 family hydrophobic/amphiphilic exporter-1
LNLSSGFIQRPIATALTMVAGVVLGIVSYLMLPVAALPNIDTATIQVTAQIPGADPLTMASSVTTQLERQFGEIPGLSQMTSSSGTGFTSITLQFDRSRTVDSAAEDVQAAINATQGQLPASLLTPPIYRKTNPADTPILLISLTSDVLPIMTVSDYAYSILAQKLSQVPGVGLVTVGGEQNPSIRIQLNPAQLAAMNLDFETVRLALASLTVVQPTGLLYGGQQAVALRTNDQLMTAQGFDDAIVAYRNGAPIRIRDIGRAIKAPEDRTLGGWLNGTQAILLAVQRTPGANVMSTVAAIKRALPQLRASLPPGFDVAIVSDRTQTITASVADVRFTLVLTIALVIGVIAFFLRRLWATVIPAISVPISIIGTFAVMYVLGYSLDNLSLMALTIAVGFVVDDAIVMVENIVRHIEGGASPLQAALDGAGEIGFTILSISISLIAVFIPLFLMGGVVGLLFREFAVTVAVSILVSVIVSLTLTPMLCAKLLPVPRPAKEGRVSRALEAFLQAYDRGLIVALRHRRVTLGVMLATVAATGALFVIIPKGFFPQQDTGLIVGISEAAQDVSPDGMKQRQQAILDIAARDPAVASAVGYIGPGGPTVTENDGRVFITLKPKGERNVTADQVIARLAAALQQVQGMTLYMQAAQDITVGARLSKTQYQFTLVDINQDELSYYAPQLLAKLKDLPELAAVASDQEARRPDPECSDRPPGRRAVRHHACDDRLDPLRRVRSASRGKDLHGA